MLPLIAAAAAATVEIIPRIVSSHLIRFRVRMSLRFSARTKLEHSEPSLIRTTSLKYGQIAFFEPELINKYSWTPRRFFSLNSQLKLLS